jgi:UrcA family protein
MNNTKTRAIRAITISMAMALGFGAAAARAGSPTGLFVSDGVNKYVVRFSDLDLGKIDGAAALYNRLRRAAAVVCSPLDSPTLQFAFQYRACVDHAIAGAVASVNRPMLSQYHESRTRGDKTAVGQLARAN